MTALTDAASRLRRLADNATPGPWAYGDVESVAGGSLYDRDLMIGAVHWDSEEDRVNIGPIRRFRTVADADANGALIACMDPVTVRAVADLLDALESGLRDTNANRWTGVVAPPGYNAALALAAHIAGGNAQ